MAASNNPLNRVTMDQCTEACRQMTRRLRPGAAMEFAAWVLMWGERWQKAYDQLPAAVDPTQQAWLDGMRAHLLGQISAAGTFAAVVTDRFSVFEWEKACQKVINMLDAMSNAPTPAEGTPIPPRAGEGGV